MTWWIALGLVVTVGCTFGRPLEEQHPSIRKAPASVDESDAARRQALGQAAQQDLACNEAPELVLTLERRYANTAAPRYVIEACGVRALYAEACENYPQCRYLLLSKVELAPRAAASWTTVPMPAPAVPSASAAPVPSSAPSAPRYF